MRKTQFILFLLVGIMTFSSCSDNDDTKESRISHIPQNDEIKMVFNATAGNSEALFYISGDRFTIDWGDGKASTARDVGDNFLISHQYPQNKEYVVTITTRGELEYFKNFSANDLWDFKEEKIPVFENISVGKDVSIGILYIQASGVKKISFANDGGAKDTNVLLGASDWDLSMLDAEKLSVYVTNKKDLEIKNLNAKNLHISVKDEIDNLSVSSCDNLLYFSISTVQQKSVPIKKLAVTNLSKLNDMRLYSLTGNTATLTNLPNLESVWLSAFHYDEIDMTNTINSSVGMSLKAYGVSASKSIQFSNQLVTADINNSLYELTADIATIDFSTCSKLMTVNINGLRSLEELKFGTKNKMLNEVVLKSLPKLKALDISACEGLQKLEVLYAPLFDTAIFGTQNHILRNVRFLNSNFSETSCVNMINSLPNFSIPNIPTVNRRLFSIRSNTPSLKDNGKVIESVKDLRPHWSFVFE